MDNVEILTTTLNNTIARNARQMQNYEIEIANMTAEIIRLQNEVEQLKGTSIPKESPSVKK